jgi:aminoglycoside phosphotransferase (APT) family kinase protein
MSSDSTSVIDIEQPEALVDYLTRTRRIDHGETPEIRTLSGGVSNRTVLVKRPSDEAWVLKQALAKLRVAVDWFSSPDRIRREALGLRWLTRLAPLGTVPAFVFEDPDQYILAMAAVPDPHANWKQTLLKGSLEFDHVTQFARLLGTIHRAAHEQRAEIAPAFDDRTFFETLRVEPYYSYTAIQVPQSAEFYDSLIADTRATRLTLVHGDYSPKNILVYQDHLILLDHEVIHFGDPAFDIGFSMTHLLSKAHHLPEKRADFADAANRYWQTYFEAIQGIDWAGALESRAVRHTLGCLLARVDGRSPLEYLNDSERSRQRDAVLTLIADPPHRISDLIRRFTARIA